MFVKCSFNIEYFNTNVASERWDDIRDICYFNNFHSTLLPKDVYMESGMDQTPLASKDGIIQA